MPYQTPKDAASNIGVLFDFLRMEESSQRYVYRGQTREWDGPLISSIYRRFIPEQLSYTHESPEYRHCLRKRGNRFVGIKPDSNIDRLVLDHGRHRLLPDELDAMKRLASDPEFAILASTKGFEAAIRKKMLPQRLSYVLDRLSFWQQVIDELHRGLIRHIGFLQPYGYMLGMTLAQQFGFASELLDFTADLRVAAFFASHDSPRYQLENNRQDSTPSHPAIGVIYRLPSTEGNVAYQRLDHYNYYTCPDQLHLKDLCVRFEDKSSPDMKASLVESMDLEDFQHFSASMSPSLQYRQIENEMFDAARGNFSFAERIDKYLELCFYSFGVRYFRLLDMAPGSFAQSRIGRQSAVMIVPDELRIEDPEDQSATFQAIEDLKSRDGFQAYYFKHSKDQPKLGGIDREFLWPRDNDVYKTMISRVLLPFTRVYGHETYTLPKRLDLVSEGYEL